MRSKPFEENVDEMKRFGNFMVSYNFPQVSADDEEVVNCLKSREIFVDGYNLILYYNKADYNNYILETLQIVGKYVPFLPFCLICKIGKKFLGDQNLSLVELFKDNRKIYCWTLMYDQEKQPIQTNLQVEHCVYEGFAYRYMHPNQVNFF